MDSVTIRPIAKMRSDFPSKFGIPRQSGLVQELQSTIVFEPEFRNPDTLRGLEGYSHLWLIWQFSEAVRTDWSPTVRPPRLGGNTHMGVFATRSPFRPNPIGLSCVKIISIDMESPDGPVIHVAGADLMDGTPIYDIKPYVRYADSHPDAVCGYVETLDERTLDVRLPDDLEDVMTDRRVLEALKETLKLDPRPSYHNDPERIYGLTFSGYNVRFTVSDDILTVVDIVQI